MGISTPKEKNESIKDPITILHTKDFLQLRSKAEKWDNLGAKIDKCYGDYDENNEEMKSEYEEEHGSEPDLSTIGEIAASAYGYL